MPKSQTEKSREIHTRIRECNVAIVGDTRPRMNDIIKVN